MPRLNEVIKSINSMYDDFDEATVREVLAAKMREQQAAWKSFEPDIQAMKISLQKRKAKVCPSCLKSSGEVDFYRNNLRKDGLQVYCINCMRNKQVRAEKQTMEILPEV